MKAMVYRSYGTTNVLHLEERDLPSVKADEVLVRIQAVSVNSWDWDLLRGKPFLSRLEGLFKPKYSILGADIAGTVAAVGRDVTGLSVGDEVFGDISSCGWGGLAEYASVRAEALSLKPASMSFEEAAAIPQAGVLALQGLRDRGQIQHAKTVLINGAGGGVGTFALQMAKSYGAEVTCVDSTKKLEFLASLGADHVIDYAKEDFTRNGQRHDLILDVVGNRSVSDYKRSLNPNGTYVMIGGSMSLILKLLLLGRSIKKKENKQMTILIHKPNRKDQEVLKELFLAGKLAPVIDKRYPLSQAEEAIRYLGEGHAMGKVVVCVGEGGD
ncbi:Bifunctional protein: zinc-containing alcohol dehydrogenase [Paenibacillus pasadenensis]|uniref:Bifunctional protein: zinc-containing alcohol dehydrogenase n=1 Tax=Paenibacillus pasadenensis TaxID=217090 RepID=A0A2N5NCF8_9BACL|nr:NAD(P)-dependent alcohol dehydrogenase [Paenibacillus pasadenensis]PLT48008.1 Bifunctional protein: zinc-containing alcohol dehydrogenase [Paenibacillus pasadenensis]